MTYPGVISGAGSVTILGTGNFTLTGANTYTGTTVAQNVYNTNHSILYLNNASGAAVQGNVVMNGCYWLMPQAANQFGPNSAVQWLNMAEFDLNGKNQTVAGISDTEGHGVIEDHHSWYADPGANATLTINNSSDCSYNGVIYDGGGYSRTLAIVKTGAGKLTLAGNSLGLNNGWTGGTTISGGTLQIGDGTTNAVLPGNVTDNATLAFNVAGGTAVTYSGVISGTGAVNSLGAGTLTLGGTAANTLFRRHDDLQWKTRAGQDLRLCHTRQLHDLQRRHIRRRAKPESVPQHGCCDIRRVPGLAHLEVYGKNVTVGGITGTGIIENTETEAGVTGGYADRQQRL